MTVRIDVRDGANRERALTVALSTVRRGGIAVVPTESMYALVTDAFSPRGTRALRDHKGLQATVPLSVLVPSANTVTGIAHRVPSGAKDLMNAFWPGELTILLRAGTTLAWDHPPGAPLAVRMPIHPLALAVLQVTGPLASTAANQQGQPSISQAAELDALELDEISVILDAGDLSGGMGVDGRSGASENRIISALSTVVDYSTDTPTIAREGKVRTEALCRVVPELSPPRSTREDDRVQ